VVRLWRSGFRATYVYLAPQPDALLRERLARHVYNHPPPGYDLDDAGEGGAARAAEGWHHLITVTMLCPELHMIPLSRRAQRRHSDPSLTCNSRRCATRTTTTTTRKLQAVSLALALASSTQCCLAATMARQTAA
jgi:hypothetical protein